MNCNDSAAWLGSKRDQGLRELPPHAVIAQFLIKQKSVKSEKKKINDHNLPYRYHHHRRGQA